MGAMASQITSLIIVYKEILEYIFILIIYQNCRGTCQQYHNRLRTM